MNFSISNIPHNIQEKMINVKSWSKLCPVRIDQLRLVEVSHYNFEGKILQGQVIVLDKMAESIVNIFRDLLLLKFPIYSVKPIHEFEGNDELSMEANNSSCFNFRNIAGTDTISMHSYGLAIDINTLQNPYVILDDKSLSAEIFPKKGIHFLNRNNIREGMVEPIVPILKKHGFTEWGGMWNSPLDYHHFQVSRNDVPALIA